MTDAPVPETETPAAEGPRRRATLRWSQSHMTRASAIAAGVMVLLLCFGGWRVYLSFKAQRDVVIAKANLLALYKALANYAQDWDGHLPPANRWTDAAAGYLSAPPGTPGGPRGWLHGPCDFGTAGYMFNTNAGGYSLEPTPDEMKHQADPSRLPLLIERAGVPDNATITLPPTGTSEGDRALYAASTFPHGSGDENNATTVILMADGQIDVRTRRDLRP